MKKSAKKPGNGKTTADRVLLAAYFTVLHTEELKAKELPPKTVLVPVKDYLELRRAAKAHFSVHPTRK